MSAYPQDRPLPLLRAGRVVFDLALEAMVWTRRTLVMGVLVGLPALFAVVYRLVLAARGDSGAPAPLDVYGHIVSLYEVRNVLPIVALFYGSSLVADEVEGRTITYLLTRPIRRSAILSGKFAAYLVTTVTLALPAVLVSFLALMTAPGGPGLAAAAGGLFGDLGTVCLTLLSYGTLFVLLGVLLRRPVIPGLLFLFGWELVANLPGYMPRLTITGYLRSLLRYQPVEEGLFPSVAEILPWTTCVEVLLVSSAVFLAAALWVFSRREYVLEQ